MLPAALLFATLYASGGPTIGALKRSVCPATPAIAVVVSDRACAALEVTGRVDASGVTLDPAFDVVASTELFARAAPGPAMLRGYAADGRMLFEFPFDAAGPFKLVLPLAPQFAEALVRLTLTANGATFEQDAAPPAVPGAEAISVDDNHLIFAWNAHEFPAIRIALAQYGEPIATLSGTETYQQAGLHSNARRVIVSFSDGTRSVDRTVNVFGR